MSINRYNSGYSSHQYQSANRTGRHLAPMPDSVRSMIRKETPSEGKKFAYTKVDGDTVRYEVPKGLKPWHQ